MNYIVFDLEWNQPYSNDISFMKRTKMPDVYKRQEMHILAGHIMCEIIEEDY